MALKQDGKHISVLELSVLGLESTERDDRLPLSLPQA